MTKKVQEASSEERTKQLKETREGLIVQKRELERKIGELRGRQEKEKRRKGERGVV